MLPAGTSTGGCTSVSGEHDVIEIKLFGETRVVDGRRTLGPRDLGGVKPRRVLEYLALHAGHPVTKDRLVEALWDDRPPATAVATLEAYVSLLRRLLQPGAGARASVVRTVHGGYQLDATAVRIDLVEFRTLVASAEDADCRRARTLLRRALAMSGGGLLESESDPGWAVTAREHTRGILVRACTSSARRALDCGDLDEALALARRGLSLDPLAEAAARTLVEALWRAGRRGEAVREYEALRRRLDEELGVDPSQQTRDLHLAVLRGDAPAPAGASVPVAASTPVPAFAPDPTPASRQLDALVRMLADALAGVSEDRARELVNRLSAVVAPAA